MFRWWYIPLGIVGTFLVLIVALLCYLRSSLPWRNSFAFWGNVFIKLPPFLKRFVLGGQRDYSTLPDPLIMENGTPVNTPEEFELRKREIIQLFEHHVYGTLPRTGFATEFQTEEEQNVLDGAAIRKQVKITVTTDKGFSEARMLLYIPKTDRPAPVVLGLNFRGNHTVSDEMDILPSLTIDTADGKWESKRGSAAYRWNIAENIRRGYAVATIHSADFAPDRKDAYNSRVVSLFDEPEFKAVGAWAFGLMRGVDYLQQDAAIDSGRVAVVGHSRLGKAAVWAGANDDRIGLIISNDSGNTGASLSRSNHGETVFSVNKAFPHWFCTNYKQYGKNENALPVDQNLLLAALAPKKLYIASAEDDLWADPQGAFNSVQKAKSAFKLFYEDILPDSMETYPPVGSGFSCNSVGLHLRAGWHDILAEDWKFYLNFMDRYWK